MAHNMVLRAEIPIADASYTRVSLRSEYYQFATGAVAELCEPYSAREKNTYLATLSGAANLSSY